jgi:hypothetical protein
VEWRSVKGTSAGCVRFGGEAVFAEGNSTSVAEAHPAEAGQAWGVFVGGGGISERVSDAEVPAGSACWSFSAGCDCGAWKTLEARWW